MHTCHSVYCVPLLVLRLCVWQLVLCIQMMVLITESVDVIVWCGDAIDSALDSKPDGPGFEYHSRHLSLRNSCDQVDSA